MAPSTQKQWTVQGKTGFDALKYATDASIPSIGENDVLVKCKHFICPAKGDLTTLPKPSAS